MATDRAKSTLRYYINAVIGLAALARATQIPPKSLIGMFGRTGNPRVANLLTVLTYLQRRDQVSARAYVRKKGRKS